MRYYAAPMEGVTSYLYRKAHSRYFKKADKYFMPFLSPSHDHIFTKKDLREIAPEHNEGLNAVPQLPPPICIFYIASPRNGRGCVLLNRQRADQRGFGIPRRPRVLRLH